MTAFIEAASPHTMNTYGRLPIALSHGQGCRVWDVNGRQYLDALGGIAVNTLGHNHPKLVPALQDQIGKIIHSCNYYHVPNQEVLAAKLVVTNGLPVKSVKELIALGKAKPGQLSYASSGNGALPHLAAAMFNMMTGINAVHVPYKGSGPALPDLIAGRTQYMIDIIVSALPQVQSGKLRALAVTTTKRYPTLPDLPTVAESGLPGYEAAQWYGLFAPAGTPAAITKKVETDVSQLLDNKTLRAGLAQRGAEMMYGNATQFSAVIRNDIEKWARVVKETGARAD